MITLSTAMSLYNHLLAESAPRAAPRSSMRESDRRNMNAYLSWCSERNVDALSHMRFRFAIVRGPGKYPAIRTLASVRTLPAFNDWFDPAHEDSWQAKLEAKSGNRHEQIVASSLLNTIIQEGVRARRAAAGEAALCRVADLPYTGGYHPESRVCPACREARACVADTNQDAGFDVVALRERRLDALPPALAAAARRALEGAPDDPPR